MLYAAFLMRASKRSAIAFFLDRNDGVLQATNERRTREIMDNLKQFSLSFEEGLGQRKRSWKLELKAAKETFQRRGAAGDAEQNLCDSMIKEEHEETKRYTQAQVGPLLEQLEEHRQRLAATTAAREASNNEYRSTLSESFKKLNEALTDESSTRQKECAETEAVAHASYADLKAKTASLSDTIQTQLQEVSEKLATEKLDSSNSNTWITHEMMKFMAHFEGSVNESLAKQEASKQYLLSLKTNFNPTS
eukprot:TRINITY_DN10366_c0_g1_i3.p1 TRINITY_DN10366_c0_g1~~TRINITY_DN10366_c0_g1_i3.p1  ORF type:complete len:249 (+),score=72.37 TRINITY_DN10366_c0_g1_i3:1353-2099(+)